jgi:hypothetical protein
MNYRFLCIITTFIIFSKLIKVSICNKPRVTGHSRVWKYARFPGSVPSSITGRELQFGGRDCRFWKASVPMSNDLFSDMLLFLRKKICLGRFLGHHSVRESIRAGVGALSLSILQLRLGWHE